MASDSSTRDRALVMRLGDATFPDDASDAARYWRSCAEDLAAYVQELEARLLALAERLPLRHARLLTRSPDELHRVPEWVDPLDGWRETTSFASSSVATDLPQLWARLDPSSRR